MTLQPRNWDTTLTAAQTPIHGAIEPADPPDADVPPIWKLHARLRGKYVWALLLALVCGVAGAVWGYRKRQPLYESTTMVRIQPVVPHILYQTDQGGLLPMYEQYFSTQLKMVTSPGVLNKAVQQPEWKALNRGWDAGVQAAFLEGLEVENPGGTELIQITFHDPTPEGALAGAQSVLNAYLEVYNEQEQEFDGERLKILNQHRNELGQQLQKINGQVEKIANGYGTDNLDAISDAKFKRLDQLEVMVENTKLMLSMTEPAKPGDPPVAPASGLTPEDIAKDDKQMESYLQSKHDLETQIKLMEIHDKPVFPPLIEKKKELTAINGVIDRYSKDYLARFPADAVKRPLDMDGIPAVVSLAQLQDREKRLKDAYDQSEAEAVKLGRDNLELRKFRADANEVEQRLTETRNRIEQLSVEAPVSGRLKVVSTGDMPLRPSKDPRLRWAGMGGAGGGMIGFAFVAMLAVMDRRMRRLEHLRDGIKRLPILGILPQLPVDLSDPAEAAVAAHCVHQLRARLQLRSDGTTRNIFAITSPSPLDGKTSLSMALALSFAGSHVRTLLIDLDVVGGGLSSRFEPIFRQRLGDILCRRGLLSPAQLQEGLDLAKKNGQKIGAALVELNHIREQDVAEALAQQARHQLGLIDLLGGEPFESAVLTTRASNLSVLQLGAADPSDGGHFSSTFIRRLLDDARQRFDAVIVDTGPVLGSLEASLVAPQADAVVLVISRGTPRPAASAAVSQLTALRAPVAGIVFNRAKTSDVRSYSQPSGRPSVRHSAPRPLLAPEVMEEASSMGPLAGAVAMSLRSALPKPAVGETSEPGTVIELQAVAAADPVEVGPAIQNNPQNQDGPQSDRGVTDPISEATVGLTAASATQIVLQAQVESAGSAPAPTENLTANKSPTAGSIEVDMPPPGAAPSPPDPDLEDEGPALSIVFKAMERSRAEHVALQPLAVEPESAAIVDDGEENFAFFRQTLDGMDTEPPLGAEPPPAAAAQAQGPPPPPPLAAAGPPAAIREPEPVRCLLVKCGPCGVKLAVRTNAKASATRCPKCGGQMDIEPEPIALLDIHCESCGHRFVTPPRLDGSIKAKCPHCQRRTIRPGPRLKDI